MEKNLLLRDLFLKRYAFSVKNFYFQDENSNNKEAFKKLNNFGSKLRILIGHCNAL